VLHDKEEAQVEFVAQVEVEAQGEEEYQVKHLT
jgi:hypothetical protein